ncbi:MAG TPA: hypothetical protein VG917_04745 [Patescibacteria group bacterium]|nr:hypothetical protein [Patescibacteria group bacterium]
MKQDNKQAKFDIILTMNKFLKEQVIPLLLTFVTFIVVCVIFYFFIHILNLLPSKEKIHPQIRIQDVLVGLTIYLKTSIDFAIFIGNLMRTNPGWKKRIAIEIGTAVGNALGTIVILIIWNFFREVPLLMAIMIVIASAVLLRMAEESFEELNSKLKPNHSLNTPLLFINTQLGFINNKFKPILGKLIPDLSLTNVKVMSVISLAMFAISIPFILGLDDFAGYIPLFSIINVFGFAVGVFLGHMILNIGLFLSPKTTTKVVEAPFVLLIGGVAFVGIAAWGFYEAMHLVVTVLLH